MREAIPSVLFSNPPKGLEPKILRDVSIQIAFNLFRRIELCTQAGMSLLQPYIIVQYSRTPSKLKNSTKLGVKSPTSAPIHSRTAKWTL